MNAKCPKCGEIATVNEQMTHVKCDNCGYMDGYEEYIETMKEEAINMAADYIPNRPGI
ncbi:MAG: hypothetical protein K8823_847 [Cenarchaeum symbiont of Oopsacas minuta]|nr:hypothetical protein [Cenarchaeum symbiont of Oopsacas minuta]